MDAAANANLPANPQSREANWAFRIRVGAVVGVIALLLGFALWETYKTLVLGGVVNMGDYYKVELRSMSAFEMDPRFGTVEDVPSKYRELSGKKVLLQGEIAPNTFYTTAKSTNFDLCYSVAKCCVGGAPKVQHFVNCRIPSGTKVDLSAEGQFKVYGTLKVNVIRDENAVRSVFQMEVERVDPA